MSRGWLALETGWVLFQAVVSWPRPEAQLWLMDLGFVYLVGRTLEVATIGRALLLAAAMFLWPPHLWAMATTTNRVCGTHAWMMSQIAAALVVVKVTMLFAAVGARWWSDRRVRVDSGQRGNFATPPPMA